ncbi:MAG: ParB/RepB/Spo0J family partition protein [Bacteroidales bacterium]|nr:ParB/RepB/Spo0J family partition protein [Bacteroidales bacterium]
MASKKPLTPGRGLDAILGNLDVDAINGGESAVTAAISMVAVKDIETNPFQPRKEFDTAALEELAQSIREQGVITPVTVRKMPDGKYQLIAGERRFRASQMAGLKEIPAYIRVATDGQMMEMALVENIQRENLNAMEIAFSYNALIEECRLTHEQLSQRVGKDRTTITNYLRLLNLPAETQLALSSNLITMAHARALINVEDTEAHLALLHDIINRHLSVHQTEQLVKEAKGKRTTVRRGATELPSLHAAAQSQIRQRLQSEVEIKRSRRGKGSLVIHFQNDADFERIMNLLQS